ncbi:MAG: Fic family protein [Desulfomicrobium sp.]|nr:Fic family protein [Desulfomicrobium sp.]
MYAISQMEPMIPTLRGDLEDLALEVFKASAKIAGRVHPLTAARLVRLLRNVNSYHSNLIEGIRTTLLEIESGLAELSEDDRTRRLQQLHKQNVVAQAVVEKERGRTGQGITSVGFLCRLHSLLFEGVPQEFLIQVNLQGTRKSVTIPGRLRDQNVRVGAHVPPDWSDLPDLLERFREAYALEAVKGAARLVHAAASHHRLLWIHPFLEGNGRVARLFSDTYLRCCGLEGYGLWTMSRGLARAEGEYKSCLSVADATRRNDYDGRGSLSEEGLRRFCLFFLHTALDQARFMDELLNLDATASNIGLYCSLRIDGRMAGKDILPRESAKILNHVFVHGKIGKGEVHELINCSDRKARNIVKLLLNEGLLETENQKSPLTIGLPAHAVQYYFPELCDPGAFQV